MRVLQKLTTDIRLTTHVVKTNIFGTIWLGPWILLSGLIIALLQWLFNVEQLLAVIEEGTLRSGELVSFFVDSLLNVFRYINDIVPISMVLIGTLQSATILLLVQLRRAKSAALRKQVSSLTVGLIGVGCVACGGSLLTPLVGLLASTASVAIAELISELLLLIAVFLSYRALSQVAENFARKVVSS